MTRQARGWIAASLLAAGLVVIAPATALPSPGPLVDSQTIVTLSFDDGSTSHFAKVFPILEAHGVHGTFYVNSGTIGTGGNKVTWDQLSEMQAAGNEIAGHTTYHPDFRNLDLGEIARQVCDDRATLMSHGLRVTSFAFPFGHGANDPTVRTLIQNCGYNSARRANGLPKLQSCERHNACAETVPPRDPYAIRVPIQAGLIDLQWLQDRVAAAQRGGGGWLAFVFHEVCDECRRFGMQPQTLSDFLDWLQSQPNTSVETVDQVIGGQLSPPVQGPPPDQRQGNLLRNPSLEVPARAPKPLVAECWNGREGDQGHTNGTWVRTTDAHTGVYAERLDLTSVAEGGRRAMMATQDLGMCSVPTQPGETFQVGGWYHSTAPPIFVVNYQVGNLNWFPLSVSPPFAASPGWTQATWTFSVPADATEVSVGMGLNQVGSVTMDDLSLFSLG